MQCQGQVQSSGPADVSGAEGVVGGDEHRSGLLVNPPTGSSGHRTFPVVEVRRMDSDISGWFYSNNLIRFSFVFFYTKKNQEIVPDLW